MVTEPYLTTDEAQVLIGEALGTEAQATFRALPELDQRAMILRTSLTFDALPWIGELADEDQLGQWPRWISSSLTPVPEAVKLALCLQIRRELRQTDEERALTAMAETGISSYAIDDLRITFDGAASRRRGAWCVIAELESDALSLLKPYLMLGGACDVYE